MRKRIELLPDPAPTVVTRSLVSVDDHVVEPPDLFTRRLGATFFDRAPCVVEDNAGNQAWRIGDEVVPINMMQIATVGVPLATRDQASIRFDEMRPGAYDIDARVRDMDLAGVAASLNFPSTIFGFAGWRFAAMTDTAVGIACVDAYNDWVIETWYERYPGRFIPQQIVWLRDVEVAAAQIRRNADRQFRAVSFTDSPERLGLPSLYEGYWNPFFQACEETGTVVNLHTGSGSFTMVPSAHTPSVAIATLFPASSMGAAIDWLFAGIPAAFPKLKIVFSEAGVGWVPMLLERLERLRTQRRFEYADAQQWSGDWRTKLRRLDAAADDSSPMELAESLIEAFRRNYWFTTFGEHTALNQRDFIGVDHIMFECDYPHADTMWPDVQAILDRELRDITDDDAARIIYSNATSLYRHVPEIIRGLEATRRKAPHPRSQVARLQTEHEGERI